MIGKTLEDILKGIDAYDSGDITRSSLVEIVDVSLKQLHAESFEDGYNGGFNDGYGEASDNLDGEVEFETDMDFDTLTSEEDEEDEA